MKDEGATRGKRARGAAAEATGKSPAKPTMLSRREIEAVYNRLAARRIHEPQERPGDLAVALLAFVLGERDGYFARVYPWHAGVEGAPVPNGGEMKTNGTSVANGKATHA
jgi:hypothetical protein